MLGIVSSQRCTADLPNGVPVGAGVVGPAVVPVADVVSGALPVVPGAAGVVGPAVVPVLGVAVSSTDWRSTAV